MKQRIIIIYDGVHNPVFQSQVIEPFLKHLDQHPQERAIIISFERTQLSSTERLRLIPDPRITLLIFHKLPFFGSLALRYAARQLAAFLKQQEIATISTIVCRGPMAAWIVGHIPLSKEIPCMVQARGLAAQEYLYANIALSTQASSNRPENTSSLPFALSVFSNNVRKNVSKGLTAPFHRLRAYQYERIERWVYGTYARNAHVNIETVSTALADYLTKTWHTPAEKLILAHHDLPTPIPKAMRQAFYATTRDELGIPFKALVYVYNGSAKPWQCPEQTVQFFVTEHQKDPNTFLLVLTQHVHTFNTLLTSYHLPKGSFCVTRVAHTDIYRYLAAADAGILLREPHIINWVSRPTKALEYQAVGLPIIHNNTIGMLTDLQQQTRNH